jgi:predicted nucleic acid-binding protein
MAKQASPPSLHKVIFDTDVLIWYLRGHEKARRFIEERRGTRTTCGFISNLNGVASRLPQPRREAREVKAFVSENFSLVIHPDEIISRRAIALLEQHAFSHGLRVVDAIITASALETAL